MQLRYDETNQFGMKTQSITKMNKSRLQYLEVGRILTPLSTRSVDKMNIRMNNVDKTVGLPI